ncbi:uncharacterized protein LOC115877962 [Sitophilus oryzae]|uniref:Uncharacterized protein LOC115877962 n=2 Tax=Sitophilus oryzae TaxID=7048 RepID=A0A6J2XHJ1_SITOR|nr:uncharacterized protein LOC115877962 [Sitophilus oryzae]
MAELDLLIRQRAAVKGNLTRQKSYLEQIQDEEISERIVVELKLRLSKVEVLLDKFYEIQDEIESKVEENQLGAQEQERENFEVSFYSTAADFQEILNGIETRNVSQNDSNGMVPTENVSSVVPQKIVQLPALKLPTFSGRYDAWVEFRDAFKALIHENSGLTNVQKFYYLRSSLKDDSLNLIESIPVSDSNYQDVWRLLHDRYEQKSLLIHNHLRSLFEYPVIDRESHANLRTFFDSMTKHVRALKILGEETDKWDRILIYLFCTKMDKNTRKEWEIFDYKGELPTMFDLNKFLKQRCDILEKLEVTNKGPQKEYENKNKYIERGPRVQQKFNAYSSYEKPGISCFYCKQNHTIFRCEKFLNLTIDKRSIEIRKLNLCSNCFRRSHELKDCRHSGCKKCGKYHNTLLHNPSVNATTIRQQATERGSETTARVTHDTDGDVHEAQVSGVATVSLNTEIFHDTGELVSREGKMESEDNETMHAMSSVYNNTYYVGSQVMLPTAIVKVVDSFGNLRECRALLDSGAQSNFISEKMSKLLNLELFRGNFCISGIGNGISKIKNKTSVKLFSCDETFSMTIECLIMQKITDNLPTISFDKTELEIPREIKLADPNFNVKGEIDLLIGSSVFWDLLCEGKLHVKKSRIIIQETRLGWVVGGVMELSRFTPEINNTVVGLSLDKMITRFWEIEEIGLEKVLSESDRYCEDHFTKNFQRTQEGNFVVSIPFKESIKKLGDSRERALQYFYSQEVRLEKKPELKREYIKFMNEYLSMGHMIEVKEGEFDNTVSYFLPHHAVVRDDSVTTKVRVVFNASMKTKSGLSLNDIQYCGPTLQDELLAIILRFRKYEYVMTADVSKMYRMILVNENDRSLQQIFWRPDASEEVKIYKLNTVTYGTASAPYLAVRCLWQLAKENSTNYPEASDSILKSFYMDDYIEGANSEMELLKLQCEVSNILAGAGFELRKWLCNKKDLCEKFRINEEIDSKIMTFGENESSKTLGVVWNACLDNIQFSVNIREYNVINKRSILSMISQIYDPLGLVSPIIIVGKLLMQKLWEAKIGWEDEIPSSIKSDWLTFKNNLTYLNDLEIPRRAMYLNYDIIELHGFSDASQKAYGCCIFIRSINKKGECISNLLCSKSRVAPIRQVTLPRLELCAALLLAKLAQKVIQHLNIKFNKICLWSDSQITLYWIQGPSNKWKTFVANRVSEIQQLTDATNWYYVKSADNPADLITRGTAATELLNNKFWWSGPEWLLNPSFEPTSFQGKDDFNFPNELPEQKIIVNLTIEHFDIISRFSKFSKLKRVFAYCLRFLWNVQCKKKNLIKRSGTLSIEELDHSVNELVKIVQKESFTTEYQRMQENLPISRKSTLLSLNPLMHNGIIRVGGRLQKSNHEFDKKHPIILPKNNLLTTLILTEEHRRLMHAGHTLLLSSVRDKFWPISGRNQVKKVIRNCVTCCRLNPKFNTYLMGDLPENRVNQYLPFYNTGCDFAGPFLLKDRMTRKPNLIRGYVCIFVCLATKAMHLEVLTDLTTSCFLATFKRFIGRRGKPLNIYTDNGKTFVGANRELKELFNFINNQYQQEDVKFYFTEQKICWHFIPARAPNFGGIWEAGVKSLKFHLKRVVGEAHLSYEDFATVLIQIEAILNSRPICPISPSPDQLNPLTPAHFLVGRSLVSLPEKSYIETSENRLTRFQRLQYIVQHFWKRWHQEYLHELQSRSKWKHGDPCPIKVGSMVLVSEANSPPLQWPMGCVQELHPGVDGVVRVVSVKFKNGVYKRPVTKLCLLPCDSSEPTKL